MQHTWERQVVHAKFYLGNLKGKDHFGGLDIGGRITLKWISEKLCFRMWAGFMWLRLWPIGGIL
jgi:hypothetical protein